MSLARELGLGGWDEARSDTWFPEFPALSEEAWLPFPEAGRVLDALEHASASTARGRANRVTGVDARRRNCGGRAESVEGCALGGNPCAGFAAGS